MKNIKSNFLSFIIISYNQESYIKYALISALEQDYENYEIIVSDDCSTDNTWGVINEIVNSRELGNRRVILNRNEKNLGIVRNFQKALSLSKGNWIIALGGDDISKTNRLKVINKLINAHNNIYAIGTGFDLINARGRYLSKNNHCVVNELKLPLYPGFAAAINRNTVDKFPEINNAIQSEDIIYSLRALELGSILLSNISTVEHRIHSSNVTSKGTSTEAYFGKIRNHRNAIKTLEYYKTSELRNEVLVQIINNEIKNFEENIKNYNYIIDYYKMNFYKKILNLSKLYRGKKHNKVYTFLLQLKMFFESYKVTAVFIKIIMDYILLLNSTLFGKRKENTNFKIYKI